MAEPRHLITMLPMNTAMAICAGIALAAACGFRVFVPLLATSLAAHFGYLTPSPGMVWIGHMPALIMLGVATVVEILAYYIPWVDHLLDTIASPMAVIAGTVAAAAAFGDIDPTFKWALALIAGVGAAAMLQGATVITRAASMATTGGIGNPIVSTAENVGAISLCVLAVLLPIFAIALLAIIGVVMVRLYRRLRSRKAETR